MGEGRSGPMGVDLSVWRRWSMEIPVALAEDKEIFMVLICLSMKLLDLGYRGEEVMWSIPCMESNFEKGSEEKGVHFWRKMTRECPFVSKGLVSIVSSCDRSWNELCK